MKHLESGRVCYHKFGYGRIGVDHMSVVLARCSCVIDRLFCFGLCFSFSQPQLNQLIFGGTAYFDFYMIFNFLISFTD